MRPTCLLTLPPPPHRVVCHPLSPQYVCPLRSCGSICRILPAWKHCHRLVTASSSPPHPLLLSQLSATHSCCCQRKDVAAAIFTAAPSTPTNKDVHHCKKHHGICCGCGASAGVSALLGSPPPDGAAAITRSPATGGDPYNSSGGGDGADIVMTAINFPHWGHRRGGSFIFYGSSYGRRKGASEGPHSICRIW